MKNKYWMSVGLSLLVIGILIPLIVSRQMVLSAPLGLGYVVAIFVGLARVGGFLMLIIGGIRMCREKNNGKLHGGILCVFGVMSILFGLSLPVLDDLCGPTASQEKQNTAPVFFWTCVAIPVLLGMFILILGYIRCYKAANKSPQQ